MISQLEVLMKEIIDSINKEEIVKKIDFERYKKHLLKYVKKVNQEIVKEIYDVMIFETVYINILLVIIEEIIKYKFKIKVGHDIILRKIDENGIFSNYELEEKYITKTRQLLTDKRRINLGFFTDFYEKSIHKQHKKILGQFYTPQTIVNEMIKNVRLSEKMKILDPACGAGIFLTEIIEKYSKKNQAEEVIRFIKNNLYANDINPFAIIMTKINIIIKVINILENRNVICQFFEEETILNNIKLGDTLGIDKDSVEYDLIIGNPPFFKMTKKQIELYYNSSQDITYGQTNIYEMFVNWAIRNVKKDGNIKYIIPQSFKSGLYFKNLRKEISKYYITCIINIHNTKNIFCGVDQAVLIINIKKVSPTNKKTEIKTYDVIKNDFTNQYFIENDKIFNKKNDSYEINIANSEMEYNMKNLLNFQLIGINMKKLISII